MSDSAAIRGRPVAAWWFVAGQFVRYAVLGGCGVVVDMCVFWLLAVATGVPPVPANAISVACGITTSFILNSRFTFDCTDAWRGRLVKFFSVGMAGLVGSSALIWVLVDVFEAPALWAKVLTLVPVALGQFAANRAWTFADREPSRGQGMRHTTTAQDS